MAATVLLHSMLFAVAIWGEGAKKIARMPDAIGAGANSGKPDGTSSERMIVIQLSPEIQSPDSDSVRPPSLQLTAVQPPSMLQITGPDTIPLPPLEFEQDGEATEASDTDLIARTKLAGLYESQIRARIERAWIQPAERLVAPLYSCRVKVHQQRDGRVDNVSLESCEGSLPWLDSLVKAIYGASPLPGPPHPGVFADSFSMQFRSEAAQQR